MRVGSSECVYLREFSYICLTLMATLESAHAINEKNPIIAIRHYV